MSTAAAAPAGVGGGVGLDQAVMPEAMGEGGGPATQGAVGVPGYGGLPAVLKGISNMLGSTPEERSVNAKALAKGVDSINGLVQDVGQTTLLRRMMEAQGKGLGFMDPSSPGGGVHPVPTTFAPTAPVMSQLGFK